MKPLPEYLESVLMAVSTQEGDDIEFVLGHLELPTARSYMSKLKRRGYAYTHRSNGTTEVWLHPSGRHYLKGIDTAQKIA